MSESRKRGRARQADGRLLAFGVDSDFERTEEKSSACGNSIVSALSERIESRSESAPMMARARTRV